MTREIPSKHRNGEIHKVPFEIGSDFLSKWTSYRDDGFHVSITEGRDYFLACKVMPGDPIPEVPAGW